jgi:hypothetical protein
LAHWDAGQKTQKCDGHHSQWPGADLASNRDQEAPMRKQVSFAIAAVILGFAVGFWTAIGVVETTASFGRSKAVAPTYRVIQVQPNAYLPGRSIEPVY